MNEFKNKKDKGCAGDKAVALDGWDKNFDQVWKLRVNHQPTTI